VYQATLSCGSVLAYEAKSFLPPVGQVVPCRQHGYCSVETTSGYRRGKASSRVLPRATPRTEDELFEWLRERPETTVHALRRQRFTLRLLAAAERSGFVNLDLRAGRVTVRVSREAG
jgi:hypothetical protein